MTSIYEYLAGNPYPGRGVAIGQTSDGKNAVILYFIMGRSVNSRNRVFVPFAEPLGDGIRTEAFDPSKLSDPSLIIYAPVRMAKSPCANGSRTVVTNGDQTDTIVETVAAGGSFADALRTRTYEPDEPNFTPRISGMLDVADGKARYALSILKRASGGSGCDRQFFEYDTPVNGVGHLIHTYSHDGNPIPSFRGDPVAFGVGSDLKAVGDGVWNALNPENKVSLFARFISLADGTSKTLLYNKNTK